MSRDLRFAALYPNHLDLNGDHGNLLVLQKRLKWRGVTAVIENVVQPIDLSDFDFVLLGHGSKDAWSQVLKLDTDLLHKVGKQSRDGKPVMAIGSGYEYLIAELDGNVLEHASHVSEFKTADEIVGYVNSDVLLPDIHMIRQTVMTLFHGPVLAKNPDLADRIISDANWCDISISNSQLNSVNELAKASRKTSFED